MKLSCSIKVFMLAAFASIPVLSIAQEWRNMTQAAVDSILNPRLLDGAERLVRFDSVVSHIGQLTEDDRPVPVRFGFRNVSNRPLVITSIRTDCGCTDAKADRLEYKSGEEGSIVVAYNPKNHPGTVDASTFVYSSESDTYPIAKLTILGEVLPGHDVWDRYRYSLGTLKLKRKKVTFAFHGNPVLTERILCGNSGRTDLKLEPESLPDYVSFRTEPEVISPGEEADIVIRIDGTKVKSNAVVPLTFKGLMPAGQEGEIILEIKIE